MKQKTKSRSHQLNPWFQLYLKRDLLMHFCGMQAKKSLFYLNQIGSLVLAKEVNVPMKGPDSKELQSIEYKQPENPEP